jgi:nucleoid-associated protein YgaU
MGMFDFIFDAGEKLFGRGESDEERAAKLQNRVIELGLRVDQLKVDVKGDVATVSGKVENQSEREKIVLALGNTDGIKRVDDRLELTKKEPEAKFYTVAKGDSLSKIAKAFYGDAMKYPAIFDANKPMLKDPDKIYPGQVLRIPPSA